MPWLTEAKLCVRPSQSMICGCYVPVACPWPMSQESAQPIPEFLFSEAVK